MLHTVLCATLLTAVPPAHVIGPMYGSLDAAALSTLLTTAESTHSNAVVIWKDGDLAAASYFGGQPERLESMSITKSIASLAIARLVTTKAIASLDTPVASYFPEWKQGQKQVVTLRDLMNMTSGLQDLTETTIEIYPAPDVVQLALAAELSDPPGERFQYGNKAVNLLGAIVEKVAHQRVDEYVGDELFSKLDITDYAWDRDRIGHPYIFAGLQIHPSDLVKLGQLVLNRGAWHGHQIISPEWFDEVARGSRSNEHYGLLWWLVPDELAPTHGDVAASGPGLALADRDKAAANAVRTAPSGSNPRGRADAAPDRRTTGGHRTIDFESRGYLGQYLVICPETKVVAVRMIATPSHESDADDFRSFPDLVRTLVHR